MNAVAAPTPVPPGRRCGGREAALRPRTAAGPTLAPVAAAPTPPYTVSQRPASLAEPPRAARAHPLHQAHPATFPIEPC